MTVRPCCVAAAAAGPLPAASGAVYGAGVAGVALDRGVALSPPAGVLPGPLLLCAAAPLSDGPAPGPAPRLSAGGVLVPELALSVGAVGVNAGGAGATGAGAPGAGGVEEEPWLVSGGAGAVSSPPEPDEPLGDDPAEGASGDGTDTGTDAGGVKPLDGGVCGAGTSDTLGAPDGDGAAATGAVNGGTVGPGSRTRRWRHLSGTCRGVAAWRHRRRCRPLVRGTPVVRGTSVVRRAIAQADWRRSTAPSRVRRWPVTEAVKASGGRCSRGRRAAWAEQRVERPPDSPQPPAASGSSIQDGQPRASAHRPASLRRAQPRPRARAAVWR